MANSAMGVRSVNTPFCCSLAMTTFTKRMIGMLVSAACFGSITFALSQSVTYKPWGVPDQRRDEYDQKVAELDRQAELRKQYESKPRPIAVASLDHRDFGWVRPEESLSQVFVIRNTGTDELQLDVGRHDDDVTVEIESAAVAPGQTTDCTVHWAIRPIDSEIKEEAGIDANVQAQRLWLTTNDPLQGSLPLTLKARLRSDVIVPDRIDFGKHDLLEAAKVSFPVYSQLHAKLDIKDVHCDGHDIEWFSQPVEKKTAKLRDQPVTAASEVFVQLEPNDYGQYADELQVIVRIDDRDEVRRIPFSGRVRPPIGFYGPEVDSRNGVDFGTVEAGNRHDLFVVVRSRADQSRRLEVLDVFPKELRTELTPLENEGAYRLRLSIPADCPNLRFNLDEAHGYVQIGDPDVTQYSSWLPVYGCVADTQRDGTQRDGD